MNTSIRPGDVKGNLLFDTARYLVEDANVPLDLKKKLLGLIRARDFKRLCQLEPDALHQGSFILVRQIQCLFKKNSSFSDADACAAAAKESFLRAEVRCRITNRRLSHYYRHPDRLDPELRVLVSRIVIDIERLLGPVSAFLDQIPDLVRLTGGATEDRPRKKAHAYLKISRTLRVSTLAAPLLTSYLAFCGADVTKLRIARVDENRVVYVPKNFKTHRTIACEPTALLPFQLAGDSFIKRRLRRWGVDLRDQSRNQELARLGSLDGSMSTIDLEAASDSLSLEAVALLLPADWYNLLKRLRSMHYKGDVGTGRYAKYASMGNGLTFALESLIFAACVRAVGSTNYAVYGDDIVIESHLAEKCCNLLKYLGFRINMTKSFFEGPFRESCGADWYNGINITPFYVRQTPQKPAEMAHFINGILSVSEPFGALWRFLASLSEGLPLVPANADSRSGVFVEESFAKKQGLLVVNRREHGPWVPSFKGYLGVSDSFESAGIQSYLCWLLFGKRARHDQEFDPFGKIRDSSATSWSTGVETRRKGWIRYSLWSDPYCFRLEWSEYLSTFLTKRDRRPAALSRGSRRAIS